MIPDFRLDPLWLKLNFVNIPGATAIQPFMQLLGQQTGWPMPTIATVMEEYRKFLFLAMRAGHPVTPPSMIEQVWMLHVQNAQNYWETLGKFITERPVAQGLGPTTASGFAEQYQQTLASYQRIFGMEPPSDIWSKEPPKPDSMKPFTDFFRRMFGLDHSSGY
jgi:hypothetical protein